MVKWFKKSMSSAKAMEHSNALPGLKGYLKAPCFWSYDQQHVARGVAAGLAGAVIPGFQIIYAAILVMLLRGNLPIALLCTLITNPLTFVPITYFIYFIGTLILQNGNGEFVVHTFHWNFTSLHAFWANVSGWALQFGNAFLIGLPIVSAALGVIGYFGTILMWNAVKLFVRKK